MNSRARDRAALGLALAVVLVPRVLYWGQVPAVVDGDEMGFFAAGVSQFATPAPLSSFGPNSLPSAHFWLMGLADALLGRDVWSARLVTALFGATQALAIVAASFRLAGRSGALTAAVVMGLPVELHFERVNMCNVWTTATWSWAFALAVLAPWRVWSSALMGVVLAAGWYGYQSSRLVPLIAGPPLLLFAIVGPWRRRLLIGVGLLAFAVTIAPLAYGFWLRPPVFSGRAAQTTWATAGAGADAARLHLGATLSAILGTAYDNTAFFPYHLALVPALVTLLALLGLLLARSWPLALCLGSWIGWVLVGHFLRNVPVYSCVLVCAIPAIAAAAGLSARRLGLAAPAAALLAVVPITARYFDLAQQVPPSLAGPMAYYHAVQSIPPGAPLLVGGTLGCGHGFNHLHRPCVDLEAPPPALPAGAYAIVAEPALHLADAVPGPRQRVERFGVPLVVIRPPGAPPVATD